MSGDAQLMLMIAGMHLLGLVCAAVLIIPALRDSPDFPPPRPDTGSDGGGGGGPERPPVPRDSPRGGSFGAGGRSGPPPPPPPSEPESGCCGGKSGLSRNAGMISTAAQTSPRRCIPAIISIS